jgi:hypothetical protein
VAAVRKAKSSVKLSLRTEVARIVFTGPRPVLDLVRELSGDLKAASHAEELLFKESDEPEVVAGVTVGRGSCRAHRRLR